MVGARCRDFRRSSSTTGVQLPTAHGENIHRPFGAEIMDKSRRHGHIIMADNSAKCGSGELLANQRTMNAPRVCTCIPRDCTLKQDYNWERRNETSCERWPLWSRHVNGKRCLSLWVMFIVFSLSRVSVIVAAPGGKEAVVPFSAQDGPEHDVDAMHMLMQFGYLPKSDMETGALRTEEEMGRAVRKFQQFASLPMTGNFDDATLEMMTRPRCGVPDILSPTDSARGKRYALSPSKWDTTDLTFRILNYTPDLTLGEIREAIHTAFGIWSQVTPLTFREILHGEANMMIRFSSAYHNDGYPFDGAGMVLAHAFFPGDGRGGDVHFDDDESWTAYTHDGTNLFAVAVHEIGHALGLSHSSVPGSLMYPWYQGYKPNFSLHSDDVAGIQYLYGIQYAPIDPGPVSTPHPGTTSSPGPPTSSPPRRTRPTRPTVPTTTPSGQDKPDSCTSTVDAISVVRGEVFIFKGNWFWRRDEKGIMPGYPVELKRFWYGLPSEIDRVDAVYERPADGKIVFFIGNRYWIFHGNSPVPGHPDGGYPITEMGFPPDIHRVDAAFVWGHNGKTYFVTGDMYWRYNEDTSRMEYDYPRDMSMWRGVPVPVDAAFKFWNGQTYFVKDKYFYEFNDALMTVKENMPQLFAPEWLECDSRMVMAPEGSSGNSGSPSGRQMKWMPYTVTILLAALLTRQTTIETWL